MMVNNEDPWKDKELCVAEGSHSGRTGSGKRKIVNDFSKLFVPCKVYSLKLKRKLITCENDFI